MIYICCCKNWLFHTVWIVRPTVYLAFLYWIHIKCVLWSWCEIKRPIACIEPIVPYDQYDRQHKTQWRRKSGRVWRRPHPKKVTSAPPCELKAMSLLVGPQIRLCQGIQSKQITLTMQDKTQKWCQLCLAHQQLHCYTSQKVEQNSTVQYNTVWGLALQVSWIRI